MRNWRRNVSISLLTVAVAAWVGLLWGRSSQAAIPLFGMAVGLTAMVGLHFLGGRLLREKEKPAEQLERDAHQNRLTLEYESWLKLDATEREQQMAEMSDEERASLREAEIAYYGGARHR